MSVNLEIKLKLDSFKETLILLKKIEAQSKGILRQKDIYYKIPKGLLKLRIENAGRTLIFYNRNENTTNRWSEYYLLKFGKKDPSNFLRKIFKVEAVVEKRRRLFLFRNTRIHLDEVKGLGKFIELETLVVNSKSDAQKRFKYLIEKLKLDQSEQIRKSYRKLIIDKKHPK